MSLEPRLRNTAWTELPVGRFCFNYFICISSFTPTLREWYHYRSHRTDEETGAGKWTNLPRTTRLVRAKLKLETGRQAAEAMPSPDSTCLLLLVLLARIQAIHTSSRPSLLTPFSSVHHRVPFRLASLAWTTDSQGLTAFHTHLSIGLPQLPLQPE